MMMTGTLTRRQTMPETAHILENRHGPHRMCLLPCFSLTNYQSKDTLCAVGQVGTLRTKEPELIYIHNGRRKSKQDRTPAQDSGLVCRPLSKHSYQCYRIQKVLSCQSLVSIIIIIDSPMREQGPPPKARQVLGWEVFIVGSRVKATGGADTLVRNQAHGRKIPARGRAQSLSKRDSQWFACDPPPSSSLHLPPHQIYPLYPRGVSCGPHRTCVASLSLKYLLRSMEMKASLRLMCRLKTLVSWRLSALPSGAQVPVTGSLQVS